MKVAVQPDGCTKFTLTAETDADRDLLDALYSAGPHGIAVGNGTTVRGPQGYLASTIELTADRSTALALETEAARQLLRTFTQLFRLGSGEPARQWHVGSLATDPDAQKRFAASLEQLDLVLQALRYAVGKGETVGQAVVGAHGLTPEEKTAIVEPAAASAGGAA